MHLTQLTRFVKRGCDTQREYTSGLASVGHDFVVSVFDLTVNVHTHLEQFVGSVGRALHSRSSTTLHSHSATLHHLHGPIGFKVPAEVDVIEAVGACGSVKPDDDGRGCLRRLE